MRCLHIYCDGAAQERFQENILNPLRMGYARRTNLLWLSFHFWRELRRAEFADNGHAGACADSTGPGIDHRVGIGRRANAAGSFYAGLIAHNTPHERNIFRGGRPEEAGGSLDEVSFGGETELAAKNFFFQREQRSFKNYFNDCAAA